MSSAIRDLWIVIAFASVLLATLVGLDAFERFAQWSRAHESWQLDELFMLGVVLSIAAAGYAARRWLELQREIVRRQEAEAEVKRLEGLLSICCHCKHVRDENGEWIAVEVYVSEHSDADFSHGLCPACARRHYPEYVH